MINCLRAVLPYLNGRNSQNTKGKSAAPTRTVALNLAVCVRSLKFYKLTCNLGFEAFKFSLIAGGDSVPFVASVKEDKDSWRNCLLEIKAGYEIADGKSNSQ